MGVLGLMNCTYKPNTVNFIEYTGGLTYEKK